jgi:hypothetical protein
MVPIRIMKQIHGEEEFFDEANDEKISNRYYEAIQKGSWSTIVIKKGN